MIGNVSYSEICRVLNQDRLGKACLSRWWANNLSSKSASDDQLPVVFGELLTQAVARRVQHVAGPNEGQKGSVCTVNIEVSGEQRTSLHISDIFAAQLKRRLAGGADASVGLLFSGGLDSTVLAALAAEAGS